MRLRSEPIRKSVTFHPAALTTQDYIDIQQLVARYAYAIDNCTNSGYDYADLYAAERAETLARLKRAVNGRCGRFALRSGATLFVNEFYKDEAYSYEVCDIRGKMCF